MARVLIVDDEAMMADTMARALMRSGHEAVAVLDCRTAMTELGGAGFDVVITDVFMPDCDGIELMRQIRQRQPDLPIVAVSGGGSFGSDKLLPMTALLGAAATLAKPFRFNALIETVERLAQHRPAPAGMPQPGPAHRHAARQHA